MAEPVAPVAATIKRFLEGAGFDVQTTQYLDESVQAVTAAPPALLLASSSLQFDGEQLCRRVKELAPALPVVLLYPPDEDSADVRAHAVGAQGALVGPLKRVTLAHCVRSALTIAALQHELAQVQAQAHAQAAQAQQQAPVLVPTDEEQFSLSGAGADFEFFKKLLLMEVKRSRRYRYPISLLLLELDGAEQVFTGVDPDTRTRVSAEGLALIASNIRDIDLAVPISAGRYVIFLPHTGRDGALIVAERLRAGVQRLQAVAGATGSVGIASFEPAHKAREISFGALMKDASDALKKAQAEGGDRTVAPERARRERISLT